MVDEDKNYVVRETGIKVFSPNFEALTLVQCLNFVKSIWTIFLLGAYLPLVSTVIALDSQGFLDHALDRTKYMARWVMRHIFLCIYL
jgi:hypothetical protein